MDRPLVDLQDTALEDQAGGIVLPFQGQEILPFPEVQVLPLPIEDLFHATPDRRGDLLGHMAVDIFLMLFLLDFYEIMQAVFCQPVGSNDGF